MSSASFLFAFRDGGGSVPPHWPSLITSWRAVIASASWPSRPTPAFEERLTAAGCIVVPCQPPAEEPALPPMRGLAFGWSPLILGMDGLAHQRHLQTPRWARYVFEELQREPADVVVANDMQPGILIGAEAAAVPVVSLIHTIYMRPLPVRRPTRPIFSRRADRSADSVMPCSPAPSPACSGATPCRS